jgi:hypothetical protein
MPFMPIEDSCIELNSRKINSYKGMTLHKITDFYITWFSGCPNITSKFRTITILTSSVKENNDSNKTCSYVHDLSLHKTSFV